jgi:hypothetical protein
MPLLREHPRQFRNLPLCESYWNRARSWLFLRSSSFTPIADRLKDASWNRAFLPPAFYSVALSQLAMPFFSHGVPWTVLSDDPCFASSIFLRSSPLLACNALLASGVFDWRGWSASSVKRKIIESIARRNRESVVRSFIHPSLGEFKSCSLFLALALECGAHDKFFIQEQVTARRIKRRARQLRPQHCRIPPKESS